MEQKILEESYRLFTTQGTHLFTMDDLAARMGISKKTLYRFYTSRQDLIEQVCLRISDEYKSAFEEADAQHVNSLHLLLEYIGAVIDFCKRIDPSFFNDLRRHFPLQWAQLQASLEETIRFRMIRLLEKGIQQGYFRNTIHPSLVLAIWQQHIQRDYEYAALLVNDYSKDEVFRQAMYLFLYGVIAPAAIPRLEEALATFKYNHPFLSNTPSKKSEQ